MKKHEKARPISQGRATMSSAVIARDPASLAKRSISVVLGRVKIVGPTGVVEMKIPGLRLPITYTDCTLKVDRYLGTRLPFRELVVRSLGGSTPDFSMDAPGEPQFAPDERVLVFLSKDTGNLFELPENGFTVQGAFQGKYTVTLMDEQTEAVVSPYDKRLRPLEDLVQEIAASLGTVSRASRRRR